MLSRAIPILTLIAVLILPLGMARANAPQPMADHHAMTGMGTMTPGHCDEMGSAAQRHGDHKLPGECAMACASALPALPTIAAISVAPEIRHDLVLPGLVAALHGLILDIATPPPRAT